MARCYAYARVRSATAGQPGCIECHVVLLWRRYISPKRRLTFNGLHGIISQKIELLITTAVRTSNPTTLHKLLLLLVIIIL
jgi:hypothetical protein